jgi:voltage-gated potassium channel
VSRRAVSTGTLNGRGRSHAAPAESLDRPVGTLMRRRSPDGFGVVLRTLAETVLVAVGIGLVYWLMPIQDRVSAGWVLRLVGGLLLAGGVVAWQVRSISRSTRPILRAVRGLIVSLAIFVVAFASTYISISHQQPSSFSDPLSKLDALYFTVTVVATVGFGDIVPRSELARSITTVQMLLDLVFLATAGRLLISTATHSRARQERRD